MERDKTTKPTATWIWYPGDFEVWLGNQFNNRRTERGAMFPPFWKQDSHWPTAVFTKTIELEEEEGVSVFVEGQFNISIDGHLRSAVPFFHVPVGRHTLAVKVWNQATPPALFIKGEHVVTDATWCVTYEDKIWIDENGEAHGSGIYVPVGFWNFESADKPPSQFRMPTTEVRPVGCQDCDEEGRMLGGRLYDFGREVFGCLKILGLERGAAYIYYGESREEALDIGHCETLDSVSSYYPRYRIVPGIYQLDSKAFRYVFVRTYFETWHDDVVVDAEMAPFDEDRSGSFRCSDDELNRIWEVSAYTLDLTTREFFCDGIKRDRWVWSGDAIQSYLMNYYLRFDTDCVKRTIRQLRGKDPVTAHVNTIMDYTFYWFVSVWQYYQYTGDVAFIREMFPKMVTLMDYVLARTNGEGMAEGLADDWIFVDWVDFPMHKRGTLAFEQILFWKALKTMVSCADLLLNHKDTETQGLCNEPALAAESLRLYVRKYNDLAASLRERAKDLFYSYDLAAYLHAIEDGRLNNQVTKFPNIFAILYDFADEDEKPLIAENVLLNPDVPDITTPYMRFYELEALCQMGMQDTVLEEMKAYWGGMLREGATTFWEKYDPNETGCEHLAMYGRPYGKSLCHAWGASPLYIIGKYFLGVRPTKPGYEEYEVRPVLGGLDWMEGEVPTPFGKIRVRMDSHSVTVSSDGGHGTLIVGNQSMAITANKEITLNF